MLAGLPYKAWLDGLSEERMENKKRIYRYNSLSPEQGEEQAALIKEIIGKCGENIWIIWMPAACIHRICFLTSHVRRHTDMGMIMWRVSAG